MTTTAIFPLTVDETTPQARQALYRFLSAAFLDPQAGAWLLLGDRGVHDGIRAAAELVRENVRLTVPELGRGEFPPDRLDAAWLLDRLAGSPQELSAEYERTFGLLASGPCPPYETEYIDGKLTFQRSQHLADVAGFYRAFGLELSADVRERPDHIAWELEFMACLIGLERQAAAAGGPANDERKRTCREAQARFLREHLAWWTPAFARLLTLHAPDGFYAAAGTFWCTLLPAERTLLGVEPPGNAPAPTSIERPDECEGCPLQV